jgi:hypothetical protein
MTMPDEDMMPEQLYAWRHGDDEPMIGTWMDRQDPIGEPTVKYLRATPERLAAKEMLAALEELIEGHLRWVDLGDGIRISGPSPDQWEAARAIIAKAKGQS